MTILVTWLWQGLALTGLTALALRAMPQLNAAARHRAWWAALAAVLGIPLVLVGSTLHHSLPGSPLPPAADATRAALVVAPAPDWIGVLLVSASILVALGGGIRIGRGYQGVRRLRLGSTPFDAERAARLPFWSDAAGRGRGRVELRTSGDLAGACALGFGRPVILVGRQLAAALDDAALDQIVMHEQAHLTRHDDWLQLLQAVIRALAGLHPAVWWLSRRIDLDREAACDDAVVARTGAARQYAAVLLAAAAATGSRTRGLTIVPGAIARASALRLRVARLLDPRRPDGVRWAPLSAMALIVPIGALIAGMQLAPIVAFVDAAEPALPAIVRSRLRAEAPVQAIIPVPVPATAADTGARHERVASWHVAPSPVALDGPPSSAPEEPEGPMAVLVTRRQGGAIPRAIEGRVPIGVMDATLPAAVPAATMGGFLLPPTRGAAPWQALARSSTSAATTTASVVASGAGRRGVSIGRAFTRAARAIGGSF